MASGMFKNGCIKWLSLGVSYTNDPISAVLIDSSVYAPDKDTDVDIGDIPEASILAETQLTGKYVDSDIYCQADTVVFPSVPAGELTCDRIVFFLAYETEAESTLLFVVEDDLVAEFPITPDGSDITLSLPNGLLRGIV